MNFETNHVNFLDVYIRSGRCILYYLFMAWQEVCEMPRGYGIGRLENLDWCHPYNMTLCHPDNMTLDTLEKWLVWLWCEELVRYYYRLFASVNGILPIDDNETLQLVCLEAIKHNFMDIYVKRYDAYYDPKIEVHGHTGLKGFRHLILDFTKFADEIDGSLSLCLHKVWVDPFKKQGLSFPTDCSDRQAGVWRWGVV